MTNKRAFELNDLLWHAPMFLSSLTADEFYKILCAILLEKSIIFVSDNLSLLSSAVLGMQCFLSPFRWCHVAIPIIPKTLTDMIDAPMPIIVGLLQSHVEQIPHLTEVLFADHADSDQERMVIVIKEKK
jgi:hypothetical protein